MFPRIIASLTLSAGLLHGAERIISVRDTTTGAPIPARVHLTRNDGSPVRPSDPALPFWHDHVSCPGTAAFDLTPGRYSLTVERGPEWSRHSQAIDVTAADSEGTVEIPVQLRRIANLPAEGWWSGETHIHRPIEQAALLLDAEDLAFGEFITWWNTSNPWAIQPVPNSPVWSPSPGRFVSVLGGEDERDGGALLFLGLSRPLDITRAGRLFPSSLGFATEARTAGAWIDIEKPFWWDVPLWIAHGIGDSIGILNNHLHRSGVLDNEAWGRPRPRHRLPGPHGVGHWSQEIHHHLLNCGIRVPPSAGSASGVLPNPVGYNRAYVKIDGVPTREKWITGLRAGRVFVSNGPLLRVAANGHPPGHVFRSQGAPMQVTLQVQVDGNDPVHHLDIVYNGEVKPFPFPEHLPLMEPGWFLVRAFTGTSNTLRMACTGPFHVELGERTASPARRDSARFFVEWCRERMDRIRSETRLSDSERTELLQSWETALAFWNRRMTEATQPTVVRGEVFDAASGAPVAARIRIRDSHGAWHTVQVAAPEGQAVPYGKRNWIHPGSEEFHTSITAHPFETRLAPGRYSITVERGKEYHPHSAQFTVGSEPVSLRIPLRRWVDMGKAGWFSGDTHVHRTLAELPTAMLAEDLNVAFPLTHWTTHSALPPAQGDKSVRTPIPEGLVEVDAHHVIWPRNTEWEIFTVGSRRHTLGAVLALGHRGILSAAVPPVGPAAEEARRQGALLDLEKHDWPWSMVLPPVMGVNLYELANNHMWAAAFAFTNWNSPAPPSVRAAARLSGTERDWAEFTFANYYALLGCGLPLVPTAGTASGVHPVPLGHGRVYVHLPEGFSYDAWKAGLAAGRSFVTTGPMLTATLDGRHHGQPIASDHAPVIVSLEGRALTASAPARVEIVVNGEVVHTIASEPTNTPEGARQTLFRESLRLAHTSWIAVRCWEETPDGRVRHAHTAPWLVRIGNQPLRPSRAERDYLVGRVRLAMEQSRDVLPPEALQEYSRALGFYSALPVRD